MGSAEYEPITGVWGGWSPQRRPAAEPLVEGQGQNTPETESFLSIFIQTMVQKLRIQMTARPPSVSEAECFSQS